MNKKAKIKLIVVLIAFFLILIFMTSAQFQIPEIQLKIIGPITNNGPVDIGSEVTFNAKCDGGNTKFVICRENAICNAKTALDDLLCASEFSTLNEKSCTYTATQFDIGTQDNDIATCCNEAGLCDTNVLRIDNWAVSSLGVVEGIYDFVIPEQPTFQAPEVSDAQKEVKIQPQITNNGPVELGSGIMFTGSCQGINTKLIICKENTICNLNTPNENIICESEFTNDAVKICSYSTNSFDLGTNNNDIATCCNNNECDTTTTLIEPWTVSGEALIKQQEILFEEESILFGAQQVEERFFEDCVDITDWTVACWSPTGGTCTCKNSDTAANMTNNVDIDLSGSTLANISFLWSGNNLDAGEFFKVYANSSTNSFTEVFSFVSGATDTDIATTQENITLDDKITIDGFVHVRFTCFNSAANEDCTFDNVNVTREPDVTPPDIYLDSPVNNSNYSYATINLNVSSTATDVSKWWYTNDSGTTNKSFTNIGTNLTLTWDEGHNFVYVWINDTANNLNYTTVNFTVDTTPPTITVTTPLNNTNHSTARIDLNVSSTSTDVSRWWYTNSSGSFNSSFFALGTNLTGGTQPTWDEGHNFIRVYINDTLNNINSTYVNFTVDTIAPRIYLDSPVNNTNYSYSTININVSAVESTTLWSYWWYSNNSGVTNSSSQTPGTNLSLTWDQGHNFVYVWVNDTVGNRNYTTANFTVDTIPPTITVTTPLNSTNYSAARIDLNVSSTSTDVSRWWYTNSSGSFNSSFFALGTNLSCDSEMEICPSGNPRRTWDAGHNFIRVYINDTLNNINSTYVNFTVDTIAPTISNALANVTNNASFNQIIKINATVTDNVGISNVTIQYDPPGGGVGDLPYNITAPYQSGNEFYNDTVVLSKAGQWVFIFHANDTSANNATQVTLKDLGGESAVNVSAATNAAPTNPSPIINSTFATNTTTEDLHCEDTITDPDGDRLNVTVRWYNNSILAGTFDYNTSYANNAFFMASLGSGNTTKNQNWNCSFRLTDGAAFSNWVNSSSLTILNSVPDIPYLRNLNGTTNGTDRTPTFEWNSSDADADAISFRIEVDDSSSFDAPEINSSVDGLGDCGPVCYQFIPTTQLNVDTGYFWRVRANDSSAQSANSNSAYFQVDSLVTISMIQDNVSFSSMGLGEENDTTDNSPAPFSLSNKGNAFINISINATTALWVNQPLSTQYFQFKADDITGNNSFARGLSTIAFTNVPPQTGSNLAIAMMNYSGGNESAEIDIRIQVPPDEPAGPKSSVVRLISELTAKDLTIIPLIPILFKLFKKRRKWIN